MTRKLPDEPSNEDFLDCRRQVIDMLHALEVKDDADSDRLRLELLDELMCMDMALGPYRKAMIKAAQPRDAGGEVSTGLAEL